MVDLSRHKNQIFDQQGENEWKIRCFRNRNLCVAGQIWLFQKGWVLPMQFTRTTRSSARTRLQAYPSIDYGSAFQPRARHSQGLIISGIPRLFEMSWMNSKAVRISGGSHQPRGIGWCLWLRVATFARRPCTPQSTRSWAVLQISMPVMMWFTHQ